MRASSKVAIVVAIALAGCLAAYGQTPAATQLQVLVPDNRDEIQPINPQNIGPSGDRPVGADVLLKEITPEVAAKVKNGNYTSAIAFHTTGTDWPRLQEEGIRAVLKQFNIKLLTVTDAEFKVDKQVSDIESIIQLKPDLLIGFCVDRQGDAAIYRKAKDAGIKISFMDTLPIDFKYPADYAGLTLADNYEAGVVAAKMLAEAIGKKGQVAVMWFPISMFHVDQRYYGIMATLKQYPDIKVVDVQKPADTEKAATVTENWLTAYPNLKGIVSIVDFTAMGAVGVITSSGRDIKVTGVDLSEDSAYAIATGSPLIGVASQHPYDQGISEALVGVLTLAGLKTPPYIVVPIEKVTRQSVARAYARVFRKEPPAQLKAAFDKIPQ
ncbi:MAG: substrate-binding domain-containing protein [Spirochaetia bacterium]|jgi:ribose transport system substrate-binding protein